MILYQWCEQNLNSFVFCYDKNVNTEILKAIVFSFWSILKHKKYIFNYGRHIKDKVIFNTLSENVGACLNFAHAYAS